MVISTAKGGKNPKKNQKKKPSFSYLICEFSGECTFLKMHIAYGQARAEAWLVWNPWCSPELWSVQKFRVISASLTSTFIKSHKQFLSDRKIFCTKCIQFPRPARRSKYSNLLSLLPPSLPLSPGNDIIHPTGSLPPLTIIATPTYLLHQQLGITSQIFLSLLHTCAT